MPSKPAHPTYSSAQGIGYRPYAGERDLPDIINLVQSELSEPYVIYTYRYFLQGWPQLSFLAFPEQARQTTPSHISEDSSTNPRCGEKPVGVIVCKQSLHRHSTRRGYIAMLSVNPSWRKMGIASTLVKLSIERMVQNGADEIILETEVDNTAALGLYASLGFIREKRLFRFYMNGKDAFRLVLPLPVVSSITSTPWVPLLLEPEDFVPVSNTTSPIPLHRDVRRAVDSTQSPTSTPPADDEPNNATPGTKSRIWHVPAMEALRFSDDEGSEDEGWFQSGR